jgi:hypothetical protein
LELLDERVLLSTYTVNSLTDTGTGSGLAGDLRYCITNANSGHDTITFAQGLTGTIQVQSALPALNASVAIQGPGANLLTVAFAPSTGPADFGIFDVTLPSVSVEISGLTFYGDAETAGQNNIYEQGAITNTGTLTVSDCVFSDNFNIAGGGAITNSGTATVSNCTFNGNIDLAVGGAILNDGTVTVSNCTFNGNFSQLGGVLGETYAAGAISNAGTATVSNCTFNGNMSVGGGGAITNVNTGVLTLNYSTLSGNTADSGGGAIANGGALTINNSTLSDNDAPFSEGGAIANGGALTINNSTLSDNRARGARGGITASAQGSFAGNGLGGGIYTGAGTLSINSSTIADNEAIGGSTGGVGGHAGNGSGGGLYIGGGMVSINNSTLADNQAIGGAFTVGGAAGTGYGGGINNTDGTFVLQIYNTILADNSASTAAADLNGSVTSLGHNLIGNSSGGNGFAASDLLNVDPLLGPLQDNGGPTQTMALLAGSPALNAGDPAELGVPDQRGVLRSGGVNIGAYQASASALLLSAPDSVTAGVPFAITVQAVDPFGQTAVGYGGAVHFVASNGALDDYTFTGADGGQHTFSGLVLRRAQTLTVTGTDTMNDSITGSTSFTITPAEADHLLFLQQPTDTATGQTIGPAVIVAVVDAFGNVETGDNSDTVTLSLGNNPGGGTLSGTLAVTVSGGIASFTDLSIDQAGVGYTLHATVGGGLPDSDSDPFTVTSG